MDYNKQEMIIDKMIKICTCKSITKYKIKTLIHQGHDSLQAIQEATGADTKACNGRYCTKKILELIDDYWKNF